MSSSENICLACPFYHPDFKCMSPYFIKSKTHNIKTGTVKSCSVYTNYKEQTNER